MQELDSKVYGAQKVSREQRDKQMNESNSSSPEDDIEEYGEEEMEEGEAQLEESDQYNN